MIKSSKLVKHKADSLYHEAEELAKHMAEERGGSYRDYMIGILRYKIERLCNEVADSHAGNAEIHARNLTPMNIDPHDMLKAVEGHMEFFKFQCDRLNSNDPSERNAGTRALTNHGLARAASWLGVYRDSGND